MNDKVPEEKRILMKDFPVKPGDIVVAKVNHATEDERPAMGEVVRIYARNPEGVTIALTTPEEFDELMGGVHSNVKLSMENSMWAVVVFATDHGPVAQHYYTYELKDMFDHNEMAKIETVTDAFANHTNILMH